MKQWFPFTDYDFYAYLTAGMGLLFSLDLAFNGGAIFLRPEWTVIQIIFVIGLAYIVGQLAAAPSSIVLEHWIARRVFQPPITVQLALAPARWRERFVGRYIIGRYYEPLPEKMRSGILGKVAHKLGTRIDAVSDPEEVFQVAFPVARTVADAASRMDQFRNLYGFSRNIAFISIIATVLFAARSIAVADTNFWWFCAAAAALGLGAYGRFVKFYAAYAAEVLRTYYAQAI